jgi:hypothetical protein
MVIVERHVPAVPKVLPPNPLLILPLTALFL